MNDGHGNKATDFRIATSVLHDIVRGALEGDARLHVHHGGVMRGKGVEVEVDGDACRITVPLDARFGVDLRALGADVQDRVARAMTGMTGLQVEAVDVVITGVYPDDSDA